MLKIKKSIKRRISSSSKAVKGFAMFLNLSEFKEIGFFDENFFLFLEEIDLCTRLFKKKKKFIIA